MKKFRSYIALVAVLLSGAYPGAVLAWSGTTTIADILVYNDGHVMARFADFPGNNGCGSPYFSLGLAGSAHQKAMHATALVALAASKKVTVNSSPGVCNGGQEVLVNLRIDAQ